MLKKSSALKAFLLGLIGLGLASCNLNAFISAGGKGDPGPQGNPGSKGQDGKDGQTAYELYVQEHPEYTGDLEQWMEDLANGDLVDADPVGMLFEYDQSLDGYEVMTYFGEARDVVIPEEHLGKPVYGIATMAFSTANIDTVTLNPSCYHIASQAFFGSSIKEVRNTEGISYLGEQAFAYTKNLSSFDFLSLGHHGTEEITFEEGTFWCSGLKEFTLPGFIKNPGMGPFSECFLLEKAVFQSGIDTIYSTMIGSDFLKEVYIPSTVTTIQYQAIVSDYPVTKVYCEAASRPEGWDAKAFDGHGTFEFIWGAEMPE